MSDVRSIDAGNEYLYCAEVDIFTDYIGEKGRIAFFLGHLVEFIDTCIIDIDT